MNNQRLIINKTDIRAFDNFNEVYGDDIIDVCPSLGEFQINLINHTDSQHLEDISFNENDTFAFYLKECKPLSTIYAEVVVNVELCNRIGLTDQELIAALAHEVSHIIFFVSKQKPIKDKDGLIEEMLCDEFACKLGLKAPLQSLLNKMIQSGMYSVGHTQYIKSRLNYISLYLTDNQQ